VAAPDIAVNLQLTGPVETFVAESVAAEADGFAMVLVPNHPGGGVSTTAVLGALAVATSTVLIGAYVLNAARHEPLDLADDMVTLSQISGGRAVLGIGAGHTPMEWTMYGDPYPTAGARVDRLIELVDATTRLLHGDTVTHHGEHLTMDGTRLDGPRPEHVVLMIGGGGPRVLALAGRCADIVAYSGLGATKADGHTHEPRWNPTHTDAALAAITDAARTVGRSCPTVDVLVQLLAITTDRDATITKYATLAGSSIDEIDHPPFVLAGPLERIADDVRACADRWGITSFTVRDRRAGAQLIAALSK
jgi:probable F420-dependent oxidoreductase